MGTTTKRVLERIMKQKWAVLSVLIVCAAMSGIAMMADPEMPAKENPIIAENRLPGSDQWNLGRPGYRISDDKAAQIKGYASATSVNNGGKITFYVTVNPVQEYRIDFFRMGWYDGKGGRLVQSIHSLQGEYQKSCVPEQNTGLIQCGWNPSYFLSVPQNWTSGMYLALLTNSEKFQNYIPFVVRDDSRYADLLYQQSVTTLQAYNNYPNDGATGKSLYEHNSYGDKTIAGSARAVKVSFDRPYRDSGAENLLDPDWSWEYYFIRWLERSGYDVSYSTNIDTHSNGSRILKYRAFLSMAHDEYWTWELYDAVEKARDNGVNLAFFGANTAYWQIRLSASPEGNPNRIMTCYKDERLDPEPDRTRKTAKWRDVNRPEQQLVGVQYAMAWADPSRNADLVVTNSDHWVYQGTSLSEGDVIPRIVGYEADRLMENYPLPPFISYTILSRSPYRFKERREEIAMTSIYRTLHGSWVFAAGTMSWSWALDRRGYEDSRIQRMTANILNRFISK